MNTFFSNTKAFIYTYKYVFIPIISLLFLGGLIIFFIAPQTPNQQPLIVPTNVPTSSPSSNFPTIATNPNRDIEEQIVPEDLEGLQKTENLSGGIKKHTLVSSNPERPNIILEKDGISLFKRVVISPEYPLSLSDFTDLYGQPEKVVAGPRFYGPTTKTIIYAQTGFALVVSGETGLAYEEHLFSPMSVDAYLQRFGEDIVQ